MVVGSTVLLTAACEDPADALLGNRGPRGAQAGMTDQASGADGGPGGAGATSAAAAAAAADAKAMFEALEPNLASNCGPCHTAGDTGAPVWLDPKDPYASIKAYPGIVTDPSTSKILVKGPHEGPVMPPSLVGPVTDWLKAEGVAAAAAAGTTAPTTITTSAIPLPTGAGSIDLPATPGGKITFTASLDSGILTLKTVTLAAPTATGVHAAGVHIELVDASGNANRNDSLSGADTTAGKGATAVIGLGLVVIPRVATADQIRLAFDTLEASNGATTTTQTVGGCKSVTSFQTNAAPAIQQNTCLNCHNTGGSGNGAMDLSGLAKNPPDYAAACAQAKNRIDTNNPANSDIILAPTGGVANHPFKGASANFKTMMTTWITAEK